ncbi:MAG: glucose 1-dehydrogenase [Actinomycetota bacterium]|nr:glucose 1-dehydrogenase [Actinomycetota bacterium]
MKIDLDGRIAVVTGGASGIGRAIAETLAASGASVAIADLNVAAAKEVAEEIDPTGTAVRGYAVDVTDRVRIEAMSKEIASDMGMVDIIVNCAGWNTGQPFLSNAPDFIDKVVALNLLGPITMCHVFLGPLVEAGRPGSVVNISSDAGRVGSLGETVYAAAKGGVIAFTKSLAREMARHSVNVNCVAPGPTDTPLFHLQPEKIQEALIRAIPLRRLGQPAEIAQVAAFLASDKASYVTGQVISVSGGLTMVG